MKKYFILKQDAYLENGVELQGFNTSKKMVLLKENEKEFKESSSVYINSNENTIYPDLIQAPVLMVSDKLYKLFNNYENTIIYKLAVLTDMERCIQKVYRLMLTDIIDALSDKSTYLKNGWIDKIVLDTNKIGDYNIFQIKAGVSIYLVVSLDVAEAMLKRGFVGINFIEVEAV